MNRFIFALPILLALLVSHPRPAAASSPGIRDPYEKGIALFEKEKYTAAQQEFRKAAGLTAPDNFSRTLHIRYYMALCAAELKEDNAEATLLGFIREYPHSIYTNDIRFALGSLLLEKDQYAAADQWLSQVKPYEVSLNRRDEYNFKRGYAAYMNGDQDTAYAYFTAVNANPRYLPHATYYTAYIDYTRGNLAEAKRKFGSIAAHPAYEQLVPFYLLQIEFMEQNYAYVVEQGVPLLAKATGARAAEIARIVSESYFHLKQYDKALTYVNRYASLGGKMEREELYLAGFCNYSEGNYSKAVEQLSAVAGTDDELGQNAAFHLGDCYLKAGDKNRALNAFAQAATPKFNPVIREEAMFNYGKLQYELGGGAFNGAITIFNNFLREYPKSARTDEAREYLLAAYFNSRNYEAAYEAIKQIRDPDNNIKTALQKICYYRALDYFEEGNYDKALEYFRIAEANRFNPKYTALTQFWSAETHMRKGNYAQAIPLLKGYIQLSPASEREHKIAHYDLGYSYFNRQAWNDASSWFTRFLNLYPDPDEIRADAYNRMGDIYMAQRDYANAVAQYDQVIRTGTGREADYARFHRALMLGLTDRPERKIEALREIINPKKGEYVDAAMFELGRTYVQRDRFTDGAMVLKQLIVEYPASPYYLSALSELGLTYQNLDNDTEALRYYKMVVEKFPDSPQAKDAMLGIRNIYVDRNDIESYAAFARQSGVETNVTVVERDSLTFLAANRIYQSGSYARALPLMKNYLQQYPRGAYRVDALYAVGDCSLREGDRPTALTAFLEVGAMPGTPYKTPALRQAARIQTENKDYPAAANTYRELSATATQAAAVTEALSGYLQSTVATENFTTIVTAADEVLASPFVTPELTRDANFAKAQALHARKQDDQALSLYRKVAESGRTRDAAESRYRIVTILYDQGKYKETEAEVFAFAEQNTSYQYWMGRSFLVLGDVYVKLNDKFQAKATYQSIVDGYADKTDGVVKEAQEKLRDIK